MSESLSGWLALREAADWAARSEMLVQRVRGVVAQTGTVSGLDLCTGTGSNLRYLMGRLPARQRWLVVDRDDALLEEVPAQTVSVGGGSRLLGSPRRKNHRSARRSFRVPGRDAADESRATRCRDLRGKASGDGVGTPRSRFRIVAAPARRPLPHSSGGGALHAHLRRSIGVQSG